MRYWEGKGASVSVRGIQPASKNNKWPIFLQLDHELGIELKQIAKALIKETSII